MPYNVLQDQSANQSQRGGAQSGTLAHLPAWAKREISWMTLRPGMFSRKQEELDPL